MRGDEKTILQQYDSAAHALFGVVDALEREAPAVLKGRKSVLPREFVAETNMAERGHRLSRISAGSVPRDEAAKIYPFLAERFTSISTMNHIRSCLINEASFLFFLSPYVVEPIRCTQTFDRIEDIEAKIGEIDKISNRDYDEVVGFFVEFIDNQLMVFLCYGDRIVLSSALQLEILKLSDTITDAIYPDALIITERGDIIGTIRDIARKRRSKITSGPVGGVVASGR